jgi:hypothetical protein
VGVAALYAVGLLVFVGLPGRIGGPSGRDVTSVVASLGAGFREAWREPTVRAVLLITVMMNVLFFPYQHMLPVFARHVLSVGPEWLGGLVAADGFGALLGALAIAGRRGFLPHGRIFGAAVLTAPFLLLGFTSLRWPRACLPVLVLIGACESAFAAILSACIGTQPGRHPLDRLPRRGHRGAGGHGDQRHGRARRDAAGRLSIGPPGPDLTRY